MMNKVLNFIIKLPKNFKKIAFFLISSNKQKIIIFFYLKTLKKFIYIASNFFIVINFIKKESHLNYTKYMKKEKIYTKNRQT